jgi:hypothetical protein
MVQKECRKSKSTVEVMKTKDVKDEILRKTAEGRLVFDHYSGGKKPHKNFLNPEYHDTKPSCSYFYSAESIYTCTKTKVVISKVTVSVLLQVASDWIASVSSVRFCNTSFRI